MRALEGSSATISKGTIVYDAAGPFTAAFSSRPLNATFRGLVAATETAWTVTQHPDQEFVLGDMTGTFKYTVNVPGNTIFRTGIYEDAITPAGTDLDLFVYLGTGLVGSSADGDSNEEVTLRTGATGATLDVYVHGWSTNGPSASGTLFTWLPNADAGNISLSGIGPATTAASQTHTATFSGSSPGSATWARCATTTAQATSAKRS